MNDKNYEKLVEMFRLQQRLNDETNGPAWREGVTDRGKVVNWRRCIVMETAELIDSFPWKHWKSVDGGIDLENIKIETVDIWHFVMSYILRFHTPEEAAKLAIGAMRDAKLRLPERWSAQENGKLDDYLAPFEDLMALALIKDDSEAYRVALLEKFWEVLDTVGMDVDELYRLYIGKNALNQFRQRHGYKEGSYTKIWNGSEDNVVMQTILRENPDIGYDELLEALESEYAHVKDAKA